MEAVNLNELKVVSVRCKKSILFHYRYFFKHQTKRRAVINDHHIIIADALDKVVKGEITRLIINIAPRYNKTALAVHALISQGLAINPAAKFIHLSYSDSLALDNSEAIKDITTSEAYQRLYPYVQLKKDTKAKNKWYTTSGGGILARSAGGSVTGFGAGITDDPDKDFDDLDEFILGNEGFGGLIVVDDPIKPEEADSDVARERVNQRFDSTIRNRVNSRNTPIIVIMQRLHEMDLTGYLEDKEPGVWTVISLPAIKPDGSALWPFKHTIEELRALQKANEKVFDTQYLQDPTSKAGKLFPKNELHYYNPDTVDVEKLVEYKLGVIDPADEGSDDLSFPVGYLIGNKIYIVDWIYNTDGTDINEPACIEMILSRKLNHTEVESNSAWGLFTKAVRAKVEERDENCEIRAIKNTAHKATRIWAQSSFIKYQFIFRSDYQSLPQYEKAMKNLFAYNKSQDGANKNKHEDAADSLAEMAKYFRANFGELW